MSSRSNCLFLWCVFIALFMGLGFAFRESSRARVAAAQHSKLIVEFDALKRQTEVLDSKLRARIRAYDETTPPPSPATSLTGDSISSSPVLTSETIDTLRMESAKADARRALGPLFRELGLSPEKVATIVDRIALCESTRSALLAEIPPTARNNPNDPIALSVKARLAEEEFRYHSDLDAMLGSENSRRFEEFQREVPFWSQVSNLATQLYASDTPLSPAQAHQLATVLIAGATDASGQITRTVSNWDDVFVQARGFLTPSQIDALKTLHDHDELWKQLNRLRAKAAREKPPAPRK